MTHRIANNTPGFGNETSSKKYRNRNKSADIFTGSQDVDPRSSYDNTS